MICSSENRFFTSNLRRLGDWTPNRRATQNRGDVGVVLSMLSIFETKHVASEFDNDMLKPATRTKAGNIVFSGVPDRP